MICGWTLLLSVFVYLLWNYRRSECWEPPINKKCRLMKALRERP